MLGTYWRPVRSFWERGDLVAIVGRRATIDTTYNQFLNSGSARRICDPELREFYLSGLRLAMNETE